MKTGILGAIVEAVARENGIETEAVRDAMQGEMTTIDFAETEISLTIGVELVVEGATVENEMLSSVVE